MNSCPKCGAAVPESAFGIYNCTSCTSVLSVDFNGQVTISEDLALTGVAEANPAQAMEITPSLGAELEPESEEVGASTSDSEPAPTLESVEASDPEPESAVIHDDRPPYELDPPQKISSARNFDDLQKYANSEMSQGNEGSLLYDVLIKGIDSEDLRQSVREALSDTRFGWQSEDHISKMRGGSIKIERLNAVKASVLVNRLKGTAVEIRWVQNGILDLVPKN